MSGTKPKSRRRKNKKWRRLTPLEKQEIITLREMGHTYKDIAQKTLFGYSTVEWICKKSEQDPEIVKRARADAMARAATETMERAAMALNAITPDSLRHDVVEERDAAGSLVAVRHFGQSALQNATTYGILADKAMKMQDRAEELSGGARRDLTPDGVRNLLENLGERVKRISCINVDIDTSGLQDRINDLQKMAVDAEWEEEDAGSGE